MAVPVARTTWSAVRARSSYVSQPRSSRMGILLRSYIIIRAIESPRLHGRRLDLPDGRLPRHSGGSRDLGRLYHLWRIERSAGAHRRHAAARRRRDPRGLVGVDCRCEAGRRSRHVRGLTADAGRASAGRRLRGLRPIRDPSSRSAIPDAAAWWRTNAARCSNPDIVLCFRSRSANRQVDRRSLA